MKVGIIGCGSIARQRHIHEYLLNPGVQIAGYYDGDPARSAEAASLYGGKAYESIDALLGDESVDAVSVCAPNFLHAEYTVKALEAGKHVLCEKPMAISYADCEAMLNASVKSGRRLLIGQNQRLSPAHLKAKDIVASGELGKVISFNSTFGHKGPEMWSVDKGNHTWFFRKDKAAMGSMADLGIHKVDLIMYIVGEPVKSVYSKTAVLDKKLPDGSPIEVDDNSIEVLQFEGGALGTVTTSWTYYGSECNTTRIYCQKGVLKLYEDPEYSLKIERADGTVEKFALDRMQTNEDTQQASSGVIDEFVRAVTTGTPSILDASDIINSMKVVFACIESSESRRQVEIR